MNVQILGRRLVYIAAMVLLLFPIYMLGHPSVRSSTGEERIPGGALSTIRSQYELGQADLGAIDPASESMRLATLGLRGVAVSILWQRAEYYKREQFWDNYSATLNQITRLEPHFVKVWDFLAWNLSYNISVEFDDFRQRYAWVKKGIDYLLTGTKYNRRKTDLPYELGWKFGNKFGVSDEKVQFRQLYREDSDWHRDLISKGMDVTQQEGLGPDGLPDSWLSGRLWYERCYAMVNGGSLPCKGPTNFYRMGPMWLINYAQTIATEGYLGDPAKFAWADAAEGWTKYGNHIMRSTWGEDLKMNDIDIANRKLDEARQEFIKYCKDRADALREQRRKDLTAEEATALEIPDLERTSQEVYLAMRAESKLQVPYREVADAMPTDKRARAVELAIKVQNAESFVQHVEIYRNQVNYQYWEMRCSAEQTQDALDARADLYAANKLLDRGILEGAIEKYDSAWQNWNALFNRYPAMMTDESAEEVGRAIQQYRRLIEKELPSDFVLNDFLKFREEYDSTNADPRLQQILADWSKVDRGAYFDRIRELRAAANAEGTEPGQEPSEDVPGKESDKGESVEANKSQDADKPADEKAAKAEPAAAEAAPVSTELKVSLPDEGAPPAPASKNESPANKPEPAGEPSASAPTAP